MTIGKKMKNTLLILGLFCTIMLCLTSCKNELNVLAPSGEESVSVYGILNPNDSVQTIRINKVYLPNGDALVAAQDANQINYDSSEIRVSLERYLTGNSTPQLTTIGNSNKKEILLTAKQINTPSGVFNQSQMIWQTTDKLYSNGNYKLIIKIKKTGREITAITNMIDSVKSNSKPFIYHPTYYPSHGNYITTGSNPTPQNAYIDYSTLTATQKIKFNSIANAKLYNVVLRFHYIDSLLTGTTNAGSVDYQFSELKSTTLVGGEALEVSFLANDFYTNLGNEMAKKITSNIKNRRSHYLEYIIKAGAESLNTFLLVNQPSNTIAQDKPNYTNINGGIGIFSSSSRSMITHDMWNDFIDKIACHPSTNPFGFCNSAGKKTNICK